MFACRLVRANKVNPGVDGMNFEDMQQKTGIVMFWTGLGQDLKDKTCRSGPVRRVMQAFEIEQKFFAYSPCTEIS